MNVIKILYVLINLLFVAKYSARVSGTVAICATLSVAIFYFLFFRFIIPNVYRFRRVACGICLFCIIGMLLVQYLIDPYGIQVDRWSALHFPIQNLLSGIYPYSATTHLGGYASPFPVWQIFHIPFYLMGNVGLSFFFAVVLFLWSCRKVWGLDKTLIAGLMLCSSVAVWYEVAVRSDLITNMLLLATIINLVFPRLSQQWADKNCWWIACVVGLLVCTRLLVLIPVGLLLLPYLIRMNWRRQIMLVLLTAIVFLLTFVPFALWDWQVFYYFQYNPWALQTRQGNLSDFILFVPLAIFLAMNHKGIPKLYYRNSVLMIISFVLVTLVHNMYLGENWDIFSSAYDITYFSSALPFCMLAVVSNDDAKK